MSQQLVKEAGRPAVSLAPCSFLTLNLDLLEYLDSSEEEKLILEEKLLYYCINTLMIDPV